MVTADNQPAHVGRCQRDRHVIISVGGSRFVWQILFLRYKNKQILSRKLHILISKNNEGANQRFTQEMTCFRDCGDVGEQFEKKK